MGFVWSLHLSLTSKNPCLSLAGDCARLRADLLKRDWHVRCGSSHRSRLLHGLVTEDGPGNTAVADYLSLASTQCVLPTAAHSPVRAQSPLQRLWTCATALVRGLCSGFESKPHVTTSLKKPTNQKPTPKHTKPLIHYSYVAPTSNIHRSHTSDCTLEVLCNPRQGFSYARKKWKDGTVQIITEIVKNTITCILPVWPQLFYCWEMHLSKVKISPNLCFCQKHLSCLF